MNIATAVSKYLQKANYQSNDNEHINIVDNQIHTWNLSLPQPTQEELEAAYQEAMVEQQAEQARQAELQKGREARTKCDNALAVIASSNSSATEAEVDAMEVAFEPILKALQNARPEKAKRLINELAESAVPAELKAKVLREL